eukprot:TRINITY_DN56801_c0_g1_i1.p1 TRINITY_DN56801_c0_g1~~TRINITY_DN56801_c0_g1_i1.p1  ORF type:complete len:332 (+),score=38.47 TRINITY_DN56801_c0_g1_i1:23-1018(+)
MLHTARGWSRTLCRPTVARGLHPIEGCGRVAPALLSGRTRFRLREESHGQCRRLPALHAPRSSQVFGRGANGAAPKLAAVPAACAILVPPPWLCSAVPAILLPGSLAAAEFRWIFEDFVGCGSFTMGLPGLVSLGIFLNPMVEAMRRIRREQSVGKLPLLPYSAMATQGMVWTTYGLLVGNPAIWSPNFCAMILGLHYWSVYRKYCPEKADWLPMQQKHHGVAFAFTAALCALTSLAADPTTAVTVLGLTGNLMTLTMFGGPLAATRTVIQEQSTRSMPFGFTCAVNLNCNLWFFYAYFMLNDPYIYVQDGIGLLLTTVQLALFARYGIHR